MIGSSPSSDRTAVDKATKVDSDYDGDAMIATGRDLSASNSTQVTMSEDTPPMRSVTVRLPIGGHLHFNPVTSLIGLAVLIGLTVWCAIDPAGSLDVLSGMQKSVTANWTWFYISTQGIWLLFIVYVYFKYGHIKMGRKDEEPEFDDVSYFTMLFAAGVAVGLFFFGVSEPLFHSDTYHKIDGSDAFVNRFTANPAHTMDEVDLYAMTLTYYHWAFSAWAPYLVVALSAGLGTYNFGLPMTMRSTLYPIAGELCWGWFGDLVDGFTILTVVAGVCTSLGLGATQLITGMRSLGALGPKEEGDNTAEIVAIWIVTAVATVSVVSGLDVGIKFLSYLAFLLGSALWFLILVLDKTSFLLNLMVEGTGSYFFNLPFLTFATDAFGQLTIGDGRSEDSAAAGWMNGWTIFYVAWWTAWSSFVGLFVARISKGRTVGSVILLTMIAPFIYVILWFSVFGGAGLRQARVAGELQSLGELQGNPDLYLVPGSTTCFEPPEGPVVLSTLDGYDENFTYTNGMPGISPVCLFDPNDSDMAWFNVLGSYYNFGPFLSALSLAAIAIYFVTSSDSGSLIVDQLASNGRYDHHWIQRVLWAVVEGGVATGLISAGGAKALNALQAASIVAGLPFTLILCMACASILNYCHHIDTNGRQSVAEDSNYRSEAQVSIISVNQFSRLDLVRRGSTFMVPFLGGIFNYLEWICSAGRIDPRLAPYVPLPTKEVLMAFVRGLIFPFYSVFQVMCLLDPKGKSRCVSFTVALAAGLFFVSWVGLFAVPWDVEPGLLAFGWLFFFAQAIVLTYLRYSVRARFNIKGSMILDFLTSLAIYPQVLCQLEMQFELVGELEELKRASSESFGSSASQSQV